MDKDVLLLKLNNMKTIVTALAFFISLSFSFAQQTATVKSADNLTSIKNSGSGEIILPGNLSAEDVKSKAKYYTKYFVVDYNQDTHVALIKMVENDAQSRNIIVRFLAACDVKDVNVGGKIVSRDNLFETYLK